MSLCKYPYPSRIHLSIHKLLKMDALLSNVSAMAHNINRYNKESKQICEILSDRDANLDAIVIEGNTALMWAADHGLRRLVKRLCDQGATVDIQNDHGHTALMYAANHGYTHIVKELYGRGAKLDIRDSDGDTALMWAINGNHPKVVKALCRRGARVLSASANNTEIQWLRTKQGFRHLLVVMVFAKTLPVDLLRLLREFV
jgi:ankyrin repeat protein